MNTLSAEWKLLARPPNSCTGENISCIKPVKKKAADSADLRSHIEALCFFTTATLSPKNVKNASLVIEEHVWFEMHRRASWLLYLILDK